MSETSVAETMAPSAGQFFLARQPIHDKDLKTFGYEIRYHLASEDPDKPQTSTADLLVSTLMEAGWETVVGTHQAFIRIPAGQNFGDFCDVLPPEKAVVIMDCATVRESHDPFYSLVRKGYKVALDRPTFDSGLEAILSRAGYLLLDAGQLGWDVLESQIPVLKEYPSKLIAWNLETFEAFERAKQLGCHYFQGSFFSKPKTITSKRVANSRLGVIRLLARLQDPNLEPKEMEEVISQDVGLSYRLFRYINSAMFGLPRKVESIGHAVNLVGLDRLKTWANLIVLYRIEDKPLELTVTSLIRARMCETVGKIWGQSNTSSFFTVGLLSTLDAFLDCPLEEAINSLPLSDDVARAILHQEGLMGAALSSVTAYEQGDWDHNVIAALAKDVGPAAYLETLSWSQRALALLDA